MLTDSFTNEKEVMMDTNKSGNRATCSNCWRMVPAGEIHQAKAGRLCHECYELVDLDAGRQPEDGPAPEIPFEIVDDLLQKLKAQLQALLSASGQPAGVQKAVEVLEYGLHLLGFYHHAETWPVGGLPGYNRELAGVLGEIGASLANVKDGLIQAGMDTIESAPESAPNTAKNRPVLFSDALVDELQNTAKATLERWLEKANAPQEVHDLVDQLLYLTQVETLGPAGFGRPGQYDVEIADILGKLSQAIIDVDWDILKG